MVDEKGPTLSGWDRRGRSGVFLQLLGLWLLTGYLINPTLAAESLCDPGFVHDPGLVPPVIPVAATLSEPTEHAVTIRWLGHSSFLIITPAGTIALTDPHSWYSPPMAPSVVTISNEHATHNQIHSVPGSARILRGRASDGTWIEVNVTVGDLSIKGLPSSGGTSSEIPVQNTIFVFRAEGLCIVHLGNLRRPLTDQQHQRLGRPDVLMVPIDGHWTLSYDQIALTIAQLRPAIVLPMHYDAPDHAQLFMQFIKESLPVRTLGDTMLLLTRATLPSSSQVVVLGYQEGIRWRDGPGRMHCLYPARNDLMASILQIKAEPLTAKAYRLFGQVIGLDNIQMKIVNDRFRMGLIQMKFQPFRITRLNRHIKSTQALIPLGGKACLVVVAPPTVNLDSPDDLKQVKAFINDGSYGINIDLGTWHMVPLPLCPEVNS